MNKFKINNMNGVLTVNKQRFIPHLIHQLPDKYEEIDQQDIIKMKGYIYIHESVFPNSKNMIDTLTHNKDLDYKNRR